MRVPKRLTVFMMGISGLFGMRTPPEPEVIAQMAPVKGPDGAAPPGAAAKLCTGLTLELPGKPGVGGTKRASPER